MRPTFISEFLIIEILYFLKMCPILIGSVDNFVGLMIAWYIEKIMISTKCTCCFMANSHKKYWTCCNLQTLLKYSFKIFASDVMEQARILRSCLLSYCIFIQLQCSFVDHSRYPICRLPCTQSQWDKMDIEFFFYRFISTWFFTRYLWNIPSIWTTRCLMIS